MNQRGLPFPSLTKFLSLAITSADNPQHTHTEKKKITGLKQKPGKNSCE